MNQPLPLAATQEVARQTHRDALVLYGVGWYAALVVGLIASYLDLRAVSSVAGAVFAVGAYASYALIYMSPTVALVAIGDRLLRLRAGWLYGIAAVGAAGTGALLFADERVYGLYGFHLNGFVWNLVITPGGLDSLGASTSTRVVFGAYLGGILLAAVGGALIARRLAATPLGAIRRRLTVRSRLLVVGAVVALGLVERLEYAVAHETGNAPILTIANALPLYQPLTAREAVIALGFQAEREQTRVEPLGLRVHYPRAPIQASPPARPLNVVWLVSESWRWDMLDPEITPNAWAFSQKASRFEHHYSGGNGTRWGMFSMFYGIHAAYWFPMLTERRPPVLMELLRRRGYAMELFSSARFSYPEFRDTIFANVPAENLHDQDTMPPEEAGLPGWGRDRLGVDRLIRFVRERDRARPFMTFLFFESPHAAYYFPPESVIRPDYLPELNYATLDLERDIGRIKDRYVNACHHLDQQLGRVFDALTEEGLLDDTIVVVTGDHGEEFMERGRWGHNSEFHEQQVRTPLILYVPGRAPAVYTQETSHIDIAATLLPLLGVTNPPEDYTLGRSLFDRSPRDHLVLSDWSSVGLVAADAKIRLPVASTGLARERVTDRDDEPVADRSRCLGDHQRQLAAVLNELGAFRVRDD